MFELLPTYLGLLIAFMLGYLIIKLSIFQRSLPDFQQVFDDFSEGLGNVFTEGLQNPTVKRAMGVLGKKSGEVRADAALRNRVAEKAVGSNVLLKKALEYFDVTPVEGLQLMNDPLVGPFIQRFMANLAQGGQGLLKGLGRSGFGGDNNSGAPRGRGVPLMS